MNHLIINLAKALLSIGHQKHAIALINLVDEDYDLDEEPLDELSYHQEDAIDAADPTARGEKYFGGWLALLPEVSKSIILKGSSAIEDATKEDELLKNFDWAGNGAFRTVLSPSGDDSFVIKFATIEHGTKMNKTEFEKQSQFREMFPKVYSHGPGHFGTDFDWIVVEKVRVMTTDEEAAKFFPEIVEDYESLQKGKQVGIQTMIRFLLLIAISESDKERAVNEQKFKLIFGSNHYWFMEDIKDNPNFRKLLYNAQELGIDVLEFGIGNLGINSKEELVVIDASSEDDFKWSPSEGI
tara:strand:+ start:29876 stop:30766 length:891 start_codon:yes stop_codon:yes gene_type:complete